MDTKADRGANLVSSRALEMVTHVGAGASRFLPRAESIAAQFKSAISIGILTKGERLPAEPTLAEHMGVSPLTVRQSLTLLRSNGLVETVRGRGGGSYISNHVAFDDADVDDRLLEVTTNELRDLFDLAETAVSGAARLAARRAGAEDIGSLRSRLERLAAESDATALRRSYCRFLIGLGIAAQSKQLTSLIVHVQALLAPLLWTSEQVTARRDEVHAELRSVVEAVEMNDVAGTLAAVAHHFEAERIWTMGRHLTLLSREASKS